MANDIFSALSEKSGKNSSTVQGMAEMFGLSENTRSVLLPIGKLKEKENHPFKVADDEKMEALAQSIQENGLIQPIIVRPYRNGYYEILAGHRRTRACRKIGVTEIRAIAVQADDELANRIMIATNFQQREYQLPSEIAKSYRIRYEDLKNRRKDSSGNSTGWNPETDKIDKIMEQEFGTSKSKIYMYLRLNYLTEALLDALDERKMNLKTATELSYLSENGQSLVYTLAFAHTCFRINQKKAAALKRREEERELCEEDIRTILADPAAKERHALFFSNAEIERYAFKFKSGEDMKKAILQFLETC